MTDRVSKVLLVGHCVPDAFALRAALRRVAPDVEFVFVNSDGDLAAHAGPAALLVNRVLDGDFADASGTSLIRSLPPQRRARSALISNLPDAQQAATEAGAVPGFGKADMYSEDARECILSLLGDHAETPRASES